MTTMHIFSAEYVRLYNIWKVLFYIFRPIGGHSVVLYVLISYNLLHNI